MTAERTSGVLRYVIDSNALRTERLERYLQRGPNHIAVLTEFVMLEAAKTEPVITLRRSLAILARYPRQVALLRSSQDLLGVHGRSAGLQRRLLDPQGNARFRSLWVELQGSDPAGAARVPQQAQVAARHMRGLVDAAPSILAHFEHHSARFTPCELRAIRLRTPYPASLQVKLLDIVFESSTDLARATGAIARPPRPAEIVNLPVFRYCLCMMVLLTRWIAGGSQRAMGAAALANDVVDANVAAYATYFDGLLSADQRLNGLHREARHLLREIGGAIG